MRTINIVLSLISLGTCFAALSNSLGSIVKAAESLSDTVIKTVQGGRPDNENREFAKAGNITFRLLAVTRKKRQRFTILLMIIHIVIS